MKNLSKAAKRRHIDSAGIDKCPYCKVDICDDNIEYKELEPVEDGSVEQTVKCTSCGRKWIDVFRLVEIREIV